MTTPLEGDLVVAQLVGSRYDVRAILPFAHSQHVVHPQHSHTSGDTLTWHDAAQIWTAQDPSLTVTDASLTVTDGSLTVTDASLTVTDASLAVTAGHQGALLEPRAGDPRFPPLRPGRGSGEHGPRVSGRTDLLTELFVTS